MASPLFQSNFCKATQKANPTNPGQPHTNDDGGEGHRLNLRQSPSLDGTRELQQGISKNKIIIRKKKEQSVGELSARGKTSGALVESGWHLEKALIYEAEVRPILPELQIRSIISHASHTNVHSAVDTGRA